MIVPGVVDRDHSSQLHRAGLGVDLDDRDVRAERERRLGGLEVGLDAQLGRAGRPRPAGAAQLGPRERGLRRAGDVEAAAVEVEDHVLGAGLELVGRQLPGLVDQRLRGLAGRGAADLGRLGAVGAGAARDGVGVALEHRDLLDRDPEPVGDDLRERRLVALALREGAGADDRLAVGVDLHGAVLGLADPVGDLDVRAEADPELERRAALGGAAPAHGAARRSRQCWSTRSSAPLVVADVVVGAGRGRGPGTRHAAMKLRRRTSAGSSPSSTASRSIARSIICVASGRPAPRTGPVGVVLVTTDTISVSILGIE